MSNIHWFQFLKCDNLMLFLFYVAFFLVAQKRANLGRHLVLRKHVIGIFHYFLKLYRLNNDLIK